MPEEAKGILKQEGFNEKDLKFALQGNYYDGDIRTQSLVMPLSAGFVGLDLPMDARDIYYDFTHFEPTLDWAGNTALDSIALLPVIGGLKYADEIALIAKNSDEAAEAAKGAGKVDGVAKSNKGGKSTDFYVTASGDVIPATGYRYVSENASYLDDMSNTMSIPANTDGTYFSFNDYDIANPGALQVPHDASIKVSFDTLQIMEDISIPYGKWGNASYLEPVTTDFPQFGPGGATQAITHSEIRIESIAKLPKK